MTAIEAADQGQGVVVLMDLGSAVLSAELALELLDDDVRDRVVLCPAPLVEGLVVAAVAAAAGADRDEVAAEAAGALAGKTSHLAAPEPQAAPDGPASARPTSSPAPSPWPTRTGCTPGPRRGWCRRCGRSTPGCSSATARRDRRGCRRAACRRWPRSASCPATTSRSGRAATRPARRSTTCSSWPPATSTSRWTARQHRLPRRGCRARPLPPRPRAVGSGSGPPRSPRHPAWASARRGRRGSHRSTSPGSRRATRPSSGAGSPSRSRPSGAACRRCAPAPPATSARPRRPSSTPTSCCSTTPTCSATSTPGWTAVSPPRTAWAAAVDAVAGDLADMPDPYLRARAADVAAVRDAVLRELLGASTGTAPRRAACWWRTT